MTTVRQLYELQELDTEIGLGTSEATSVQSRLGDRSDLDARIKEIEARKTHLDQARVQQKTQELDANAALEKVQQMEAKLYDGTVTNLRELESSQREAEFMRSQLKEMDDGLLETLLALEEAQEQLRLMETGLQEAEEQWQRDQEELGLEQRRLKKTIAGLAARRKDMVAQVSPSEVTLYERLRAAKGGLAIAKVERGLCRGCRMALPTHQLQRARAGQESVLCNSCGRILYVS